MAVLAFMGFDHLHASSTGNDLGIVYPEWTLSTGISNNWSLVAGQLGGFAAQTSGGNELQWTSPSATYGTIIVGMRAKTQSSAFSGIDRPVFTFIDGTSSQCTLSMSGTTGFLFLSRSSPSLILQTGTTVMLPNTWYFIEIKITFGAAASYEIKLGGTAEFSGTGDTTSTANNFISSVKFWANSSGTGFQILDDIYISDTSGSAPTNDFLGIIRVETALVTSNNSVQWTPLASTNASNVDDPNVDGDTTYNSSSTTGHVDTFNHGALSSTPSAIYGVAVVTKFRKDDVATRNLRNKMISGATTSNGVSVLVDTIYKWTKDYYPIDPDTGVAWTTSGVNATKIGYEHL